MTDSELAIRFFLQLAVILTAGRIFGWIGRRFLGQTQVVMEMVAGVLLGPSLFGLIAPDAQAWLFPTKIPGTESVHPSMSIMSVVSQLGLVLYMFLIGLELNVGMLRERAKGAVSVSIAGTLVPFILGAGLAVILSRTPGYFGPDVSIWTAAPYLGAAMSITAFPVLARIIAERGLKGTSIGTLALAAGAAGDAVAWGILAIVVASLKSTISIALLAIVGGGAFVLLMATVGNRLFRALEAKTIRDGHISPSVAGAAFVILTLSAWISGVVGLYEVFGAFICGIVVPRGAFSKALTDNLEHITGSLLVPLFFVYSGLKTELGLVASGPALGVAAIVIAIAILGKWGGCAAAARMSGESWREANSIGILMNARGLMELIILNVGLQHGLISPTLFSIMVLMAIVTTLMTSPLFTLANPRPRPQAN